MRILPGQEKSPIGELESWSDAYIGAALKDAGTNWSKLARKHGLSRGCLRNALDRKYPKAERIIAEAIGVQPKDIWPSRYE